MNTYKQMTSLRIEWEWVVEQVDDAGDIIDCDYYERLTEALANLNLANIATGIEIGICRITGSIADGVTDRSYAYPIGTELPERTEDGHRIPLANQAEWKRSLNGVRRVMAGKLGGQDNGV